MFRKPGSRRSNVLTDDFMHLQVGQTSRVAATGMPVALTLIQILGVRNPFSCFALIAVGEP